MARITQQMQRLTELKERLTATIAQHQRAIEAFQNQLLGVEASIRALNSTAGATPPPRRNVKRAVLEIVQEAGTVGVTASEVMDRASAKGRTLNASSVASLLSRFKQEGILKFDGERYTLAAPQAPQEPPLKIVKTANGG
jgi:hypothetical protein